MTVRAVGGTCRPTGFACSTRPKLPGRAFTSTSSVDALVDAIAILAVQVLRARRGFNDGRCHRAGRGAERGWSADDVLEAVDRIAARGHRRQSRVGCRPGRRLIDQGRDAVLEATRRVAVEDKKQPIAASSRLGRTGCWRASTNRVCGCSPVTTPARSQPQGWGLQPWGWCELAPRPPGEPWPCR